MDSELVSGVKQLMSPTKVALPSGCTNEAKIVSRKPYDENSIDRVQDIIRRMACASKTKPSSAAKQL